MVSSIQSLDNLELTSSLIKSLKQAAGLHEIQSAERIFPFLDNVTLSGNQEIEKWRKLQAFSLWMVDLIWPDLPYEITLNWKSYWDWAKQRTGYDQSTISNRLRVARAWWDPSVKLPDRVILRDENGQPIIDGRGGGVLSISPNPLDPPISKLILTAKAFEEGELTEEELGMVFNPKVTFNQMHTRLLDRRLGDGRSITRYSLDGPFLVITEDGESEAFGELYVDDESRLIKRGIEHILAAASVRFV